MNGTVMIGLTGIISNSKAWHRTGVNRIICKAINTLTIKQFFFIKKYPY